jgi:hypothetical protein
VIKIRNNNSEPPKYEKRSIPISEYEKTLNLQATHPTIKVILDISKWL